MLNPKKEILLLIVPVMHLLDTVSKSRDETARGRQCTRIGVDNLLVLPDSNYQEYSL